MIAICIGHSRLINGHPEGGAVSVERVSEWEHNSALGHQVCQKLDSLGIRNTIVNRYDGNGYTAAQKWLAGRLKQLGATAAIELHFNCSDNAQANGHEWLHWHNSLRGEDLAARLCDSFRSSLTMLLSRGLKPRTSADRGAEFLRLTPCPAVIAEPFFGSNTADWDIAKRHAATMADALARGISAWHGIP